MQASSDRHLLSPEPDSVVANPRYIIIHRIGFPWQGLIRTVPHLNPPDLIHAPCSLKQPRIYRWWQRTASQCSLGPQNLDPEQKAVITLVVGPMQVDFCPASARSEARCNQIVRLGSVESKAGDFEEHFSDIAHQIDASTRPTSGQQFDPLPIFFIRGDLEILNRLRFVLESGT